MGWAAIYLLIAAIMVIFLNNYSICSKVDCYFLNIYLEFLNIYLDILFVHDCFILIFTVHDCSRLFTIVHDCSLCSRLFTIVHDYLTVCSPFVVNREHSVHGEPL